jgi:GNAT superfamily N-acetyltransferase
MERGPSHYAMFHASMHGAGVATAFLVYSAATAGLYGMATSRDFEGKGIGRALLAQPTARTRRSTAGSRR